MALKRFFGVAHSIANIPTIGYYIPTIIYTYYTIYLDDENDDQEADIDGSRQIGPWAIFWWQIGPLKMLVRQIGPRENFGDEN